MIVTISRKAHFNAAHRLYRPYWDNAKNEKEEETIESTYSDMSSYLENSMNQIFVQFNV